MLNDDTKSLTNPVQFRKRSDGPLKIPSMDTERLNNPEMKKDAEG